MFQRRLEGEGSDLREINLTPLIDVCLVLVVILLVATPLAFESAIAVRNAVQLGRKAEQVTKNERIEVGVVSDSTITVNRKLVMRSELRGELGPLLAESVTRRVVVKCAGGVAHGTFVNVLDQARLLGAAEIAVLGE
jgi:biopolymer transport protein ExbD